MGEIADMMIEGILDANGEYTGKNPGHPIYPKGWFSGKKEFVSSYPSVKKVKTFLLQRGIPEGNQQKEIVNAYGKHIGNERPTNHACSNWKTFKAFVDERIGYIKPSQQQK